MASVDNHPSVRNQALALLQAFEARILPGILRRIGTWKRISPSALTELGQDVAQELTIDCLERAALVVQTPSAERHAHWIRLAERWIYHQHVRPHRRGTPADPNALAAPLLLSSPGEAMAPSISGIVQLKNGRCNLRASAQQSGSSIRAVRRQLDRLAERLEANCTPVQFWRRRLAEALVGLGSDLLRQQAPLHLLPATRRDPDPAARLLRIRRLATRFQLHRTPLQIRKTLAFWTRSATRAKATARQALLQATGLRPECSAGWLWLFEALVIEGELLGAARTLRSCRRHAPPNAGRILLARARLLEVRGKFGAAMALITRAQSRWPLQGRLRQARNIATNRYGLRASNKSLASSRSAAASPRMLPQ